MNNRSAAEAYHDQHYRSSFRTGEGTEEILAALKTVPAVRRWVDLGSGSQTLLWALALDAAEIVAVDNDEQRLKILRRQAHRAVPEPIHTTVSALCGRDPGTFIDRCATITDYLRADCLTGRRPRHQVLQPAQFDLVTQFGLLGLCRDTEHFVASFAGLHELCAPGAWAVGANWVAADRPERVRLSASLYWHAADSAAITLTALTCVTSADPQFPRVWIYAGTR